MREDGFGNDQFYKCLVAETSPAEGTGTMLHIQAQVLKIDQDSKWEWEWVTLHNILFLHNNLNIS